MRSMVAFLAAMGMILALADGADAGSVANDSPFCAEKDDLVAYARATADKDTDRMLELVADRSCLVLHSDTPATVVSTHDDGSIVQVQLSRGARTLTGFALADHFSE